MTRETPGDWVQQAATRGLSPQEMVQLYHIAALAKQADAKATAWFILLVLLTFYGLLSVIVVLVYLWRL